MPSPTLDFWYEFASTYSYLSVMRGPELARAAGVTLVWRPFLLGPIFAELGWQDSPFKLQPAKGRYMWRDLERLTAALDLPFQRPSAFPRSGLIAARVALTLEDREPFTQAVFHANFAEDRSIERPEVIAELLADLGLDAPAVLEAAKTPENKERLRASTQSAMDHGLFGAPSFTTHGELFWGHDRMEQALAWAVDRAVG